MVSVLWLQELLAVDCLPIKAQVLPSDSTPGSMSEGVPGESRADELVWVAGWVGLHGRVVWSVRYDAQSERGLARWRRWPLGLLAENLRPTQLLRAKEL